jgi:RimJ/RimL family protein N-acetyltransferase
MSPVVIRPARLADLESIYVTFEQVAAEGRWIGRELPLDREATRQRFRSSLTEPGHYVSVAEIREQEPAGPAGPVDPSGGLVGQLHLGVAAYGVAELGMHVAAERRGQGIGRALMQDAIAWAIAEPGVHKIALQVWPHNVAAQNLYRSCGFEQEGYLRSHYRRKNGELWDAVVMGLLLNEGLALVPATGP